MAGFTDILGSLIQQGMTQSGAARTGKALGEGGDGPSLSDLLRGFGADTSTAGGGYGDLGRTQDQGGGSSLGDILGQLGKMSGGGQPDSGSAGGGSLGDLLGQLGKMVSAGQSEGAPPHGGQQPGSGSVLGDLLGNIGDNKAALGGLGALVGALLGGGKSSAGGAVGGGVLAVLASLALSALKNAGEEPTRLPRALAGSKSPEEQMLLENDAEVIVKAMINAAKADGRIDNDEIDKIVGKLDDDGLSQHEKELFISEANKPLDLEGVVRSAANRPEMAAQIYAASLLAIEVDTTAEQRYMQQLASGLGLNPRVAAHIEQTLGV
jgi:uncharacterized membrane protein YebE (DUF533 family)